jgi:uncharacterized protein (TIGR02646 family)
MIKIAKPSQQDQAWQEIFTKAAEGRAKLIQEFEKTGDATVDDQLYKKYMKYLLALFNGKCAYCETDIVSNQPGDVEHFRPKGRVVDDNFKPVRVKYRRWGETDHAGYYWLAYDWDNLFPSCIDCNRYRKHGTGADAGAGKADRFPVEGPRALEPDDELKESALLINPSIDDPAAHLQFLDTGEIVAVTAKGKQTLQHLGLNRREGLLKARKIAFGSARSLLKDYYSAVANESEDANELRERINNIWSGREPYTAMQRLGFELIRQRFRKGGLEIEFPLQPEP